MIFFLRPAGSGGSGCQGPLPPVIRAKPTRIVIADASPMATYIGQPAMVAIEVTPKIPGSVQFAVNGHSTNQIAAFGGNNASLPVTLPSGSCEVRATFMPYDQRTYAMSSPSNSITHFVNKAGVQVKVLSPSALNDRYDLKAEVSVLAPAVCPVQGSVQFAVDGLAPVALAPCLGGVATLRNQSLVKGHRYNISATFHSTGDTEDGSPAQLIYTPP